MKKNLIIVALLVMAPRAYAQDQCDLGLQSAYLTDYFCSALDDITDPGLGTRSMTDETDTSNGGLDPLFAEIGVLKEAYRTDPRKTLELIQRIKSAGGLPEE